MTIRLTGGEYYEAITHVPGGCVRGLSKDMNEAIKRCKQLAMGRVSPARQTKD